jgi:hypothetical protein
MSKVQKTIKLNSDIYDAAEEWIKKGGSIFNFSTLAESAIRKFITETQELEPVSLSKDQALELTDKAMRKHKKALDRMK